MNNATCIALFKFDGFGLVTINCTLREFELPLTHCNIVCINCNGFEVLSWKVSLREVRFVKRRGGVRVPQVFAGLNKYRWGCESVSEVS